MVHKVAMKVVECLINNKIIDENDRVIYQFGAESLLMNIVHYTVMEVIGWGMGFPVETVIFIIVYKMLRINAGGHHFESPKICFASSCILVILTFLPMHIFAKGLLVKELNLLFVIEILAILIYSPCDNHKKKMNKFEKKVYKIRTVVLLAILCGVYVVCQDSLWKIKYIIVLSMFWESIGLAAGAWKNKRDKSL